jgi:conjugative transfer signal peptidase TraF
LRSAIITACVVVAVVASSISPPRQRLIWNTTASTPIGLYTITQAIPQRGDLVLIRLPPDIMAVAVSRGLLLPNTPVLKPVVAVAGDLVCRSGAAITINGRPAAIARELDQRGRRLPIWRGCRHLSQSQVFVLARHPDSFDSRYYGPLDAHAAHGVAHPLMIVSN